MNPVQQERARCAKLVRTLISRNETNQLWKDKLNGLLKRIENPPKSTGKRGGPLTEQLELPFDY